MARKVDDHGKKTLRKLHHIEQFRINGWGLSSWVENKSPCSGSTSVDVELLADFAGESWSLCSYVPICLAAFGSVDWAMAIALKKSMLEVPPIRNR